MLCYFLIVIAIFIVPKVYTLLYRKFLFKLQINHETKVLITGACHGIGRLLAGHFASNTKCVLIIIDIRDDLAPPILKELKELGSECHFYKADLGSKDQALKVCKDIISKFGYIDILVNNAAIVHGGPSVKEDDVYFERTLQVNLLAPMLVLRSFLPIMYERNRGHIVTVASMVSHVVGPGYGAYVASKFGVYGFHMNISQEIMLAKKNIDCTAVFPYAINTGMFEGFSPKLQSLMPVLSQYDVAKRIYEGIIYKEKEVFIPWHGWITKLLFSAIPVYMRDKLACYISGDTAIVNH